MNQLPIELTLYYPTAAQFEAYLGFVAVLSIITGMIYLTLPMWRWSARRVVANPNGNAWPALFLSANPIGAGLLLAIHVAGKLENAEPWPIFLLWLLSPLAALYVFSALT